MKRLIVALLLTACAHQPSQQEEVRRYTVLTSTNRAGAAVVTVRGDERVVDYEYNDRGRGPKTHSVIRVDDRSLPVSVETKGNDYLKSPVEERFTFANGVARWNNPAEGEGSREGGGDAFYASMYGPPEELGILARALLMAPEQRLPLLPAGEARIRRIGEQKLGGKRVTHYEITGFGFTPFDLWLDDDRNLFGIVNSYQSVIREGHEADAAKLIAVQDEHARGRFAAFASKLTKQPRSIVVMNTRIFDPVSGAIGVPTTIVVQGNRIAGIGGAAPADAHVIDAGNRIVLPGLWDMHGHLGEIDGLLNIAAGVTSARDLGNDIDFIGPLKAKMDDGSIVGPRLVLAGFIDGPGPFKAPTNVLADNEEEARKAIDRYADLGYEQIKIYSSVKPELVAPMAKHAHARGLRVSGHIPAGMIASQAIDAGYDEIQHANMLFLNFWPDVKETRTPARFTAVAERATSLDLNSAEVRAFIEQLKAKNVVVDPTLGVFEALFTARARQMAPGFAPIAERLPAQIRRGALTGGLPVPEGMDERYRGAFAQMMKLTRMLHDAGVRIVAGTDGMAGFMLHRELELYAQAGIPNVDVLRIATLVPAQVTNRTKDLGTIEAGKLADFVIVDGDPTRNISDIRRVVTVVKDGRVFDSRAIYEELGVR